jgi:hypothetical protein
MNHAMVEAQMRSLVGKFIPRNCQSFKYAVYDGQPQASALGFYVDPKPFEGKVVAELGDGIVVKLDGKRAEFAVLDRALVTQEPGEGAKVRVEPYARRRFDGERADAPKREIRTLSDGTQYVTQSLIMEDATAKLPIPEPRCPELRNLIEQLERLRAPDGFRHLSHVLVDAGARDFTWVDPLPEDILKTPPAVSFTVATAKYQGRVTVRYESDLDLYAVELSRDGELVERAEQVSAASLVRTLEELIDDGNWRRIRVQSLTSGKSTRH